MELLALLEQEEERCRALYEEKAGDSFLSHCLHAQLEATQELTEKLRRGEDPAELSAFLRAELPRLEQAAKEEEEHPSFDWYDDHYQCKLILGRIDAYRAVLRILEDRSAEL